MTLLRELSPLVEPVSIDEAYVDLAAMSPGHDLSVAGVTALGNRLKERIAVATGGVTGSVGIGTSKLMAKLASDMDKPDGLVVVEPGTELEVLHPLPVTRLGGVGPATAERLHQVGVKTVADLAAKSLPDLVALAGRAHGAGLYSLARAEDDRAVVPDREAKSVSAEETFERDLTDLAVLGREIDAMAARVGGRLRASAYSGPHGHAQAAALRLHHDHPVADAGPAHRRRPADRRHRAAAARRCRHRRRPAPARRRRLRAVGLRAGRPVRRGRRARGVAGRPGGGRGRAGPGGAPNRRPRPRSAGGRGRTCGTRSSAPAGCGAAGWGGSRCASRAR